MAWKSNAKSGQIMAGGYGQGNESSHLSDPTDLIIDKESDSLIICDKNNRRVVRWPRQGNSSGQTIISNIDCWGLMMDDEEFLYVSDWEKNVVRRWQIEERNGTIVSGGNGEGNHVNQLNSPGFIFVDRNHSVYVSDWKNHRVMKWMKGAREGIVVAGGEGNGNDLGQLSYPQGVVVDQLGTVYVADWGNNRVMCWPEGAKNGSIIVGGNGNGKQANQLSRPQGLSFDRQGNLYVADEGNHRVQRFDLIK
ncbi:unnamed protein product [Rotaria sp. Silwood1]|nr:unnamed protein product [Rotaria sp. Silwood1]